MLFQISDAVFVDPDSWHDLEVLLDLARRQKCYVDAENAGMAIANPWLNQASPRRQADWQAASDWAVKDMALYRLRSFVADSVADPKAVPPRVTLGDAIYLGESKAALWVENGRNDRRFLLGMMTPDRRAAFEEWEDRDIFEFRNGGGLGEARKAMEDLATRKKLDPRMNWALFDSDGEVPSHRSNDARLMVNFCEGAAIEYHCLDRRAIENYLPQKALWAWGNVGNRDTKMERRARLEAYKRMSAPQRHHFHLKSGWEKTPSDDVCNLYASVPEADHNALAKGIDKDLASLYDFYADFMHDWVTEEGIDPGLQAMIDDVTNWMRVPYA